MTRKIELVRGWQNAARARERILMVIEAEAQVRFWRGETAKWIKRALAAEVALTAASAGADGPVGRNYFREAAE